MSSESETNYQESHHKLAQEAQQIVDRKEELERATHHLIRDGEKMELEFRADIQRLTSERDLAQENYEESMLLVRKQQEESFKHMNTGRWLPMEDNKVIDELSQIKGDMRDWAKTVAVNSMDALKNLDHSEFTGLLESLSAVLILENNSFPKGLSTPKSPALLLNALLAHHLYSTMFRDPFFFFEGGNGNESSQDTGGGLFRGIYRMAQEANKKSAHGWRSQTLRLLHPALGADTTDGERQMRATTEKAIAKISRKQASSFLDIYQETGTLSYSLWTQKTTLTCHSTLSEMGPRTFDAKSKYLKPHPLVNYDDHDDKLKGKPITLIVHPLIQAFGTGDGKDYNKGRIWASAEVWLDSK
ncbi:hypothetical protein N431DRAFT_497102 [Stipitochalara longipes BDJ]|nr:hypothetical protein N431DRAFT_497102 [Stipitochalara longipes BDJ]